MKRIVKRGILILGSVLLLAGCGGNRREEYRTAGIEQLQSGDYAAAMESFGLALEQSKGKVTAFELDVLKYRAEAEYLLEDYQAAAHTYDVLLQVDEVNLDYYLYRCLALAKAGDLPAAVEVFQSARALLAETPDEAGTAKLMRVVQDLGAMLESQAEYRDTALSLYQELADGGYHSAVLFNRMGLNRIEAKDYDGAISLFEKGLQAGDAGQVKELRFNQAVAYEYKAEYKRALELFEDYIAEYGEDEEARKEINFLRTR